jgi:hypothetical protein
MPHRHATNASLVTALLVVCIILVVSVFYLGYVTGSTLCLPPPGKAAAWRLGNNPPAAT